ncbi:MAG: AbrB/MazE/SpoVT family DNA-binding domain-containing protein [Phycisphaerae bacterium]|nr:AbrB/MazE/SpoVT family DNA-binding domain-containing protein [Phycisphaerae bacterium]
MVKTLTRHGNSYAVVIDKPVLDLLNITPQTPLEITTDGQTLVLTPMRSTGRQRKFNKALVETNRAFGRALRKLGQ